MKKIIITIFIILLLLFVFFLFKNQALAPTKNELETLKIGSLVLEVEVLRTEEERQLGLSNRESLGQNSGMFFIFNKPDQYGFWMKDMNFPIDIFWINEELEIVSINKNVKPESYPEVFYPEKPIIYVLETNAGLAEKNNIKKGDLVFPDFKLEN